MTKLYKPLLDALALTYPQYLVMLVLWESDGPTVSAMGERLSLDSGTLTPLLKRMESAGWLTRQRSSEDERRVHVWLTPAGHQLQSQAAHIPGCVLAQSGLSLADLIGLNQQIKKLRSAMHAPGAAAEAIHHQHHTTMTLPMKSSRATASRRSRQHMFRALLSLARLFAMAMTLSLGMAAISQAADTVAAAVKVDDNSFRCMRQMTPVRHFFVDNLTGDIAGTLAAAKTRPREHPTLRVLVVQLVPTEAMVKRESGFSPATGDWEFFELDVNEKGAKIGKRGFAEVNNRFGKNCFACHAPAREPWDFICESNHGCDAIPIDHKMTGALHSSTRVAARRYQKPVTRWRC